MFFESKLADFFARMAAGLVIGMLFGFILSETSFQFMRGKESVQREPQRTELVIPYGTADRIKEGALVGSLLDDLILVQGDILIVRNEDTVSHQLGPLWVPANTASVLELNTASKYTYECTFQPDQSIGLDVRPRVDTDTRLQAMLAVGLPSGMMLGVYSYLMSFQMPWRKKTSSATVDTV